MEQMELERQEMEEEKAKELEEVTETAANEI